MLRKQILEHPAVTPLPAGEINVTEVATVLVTSETADHPIDNVFDGRRRGKAWRADIDLGF
jgi:hypothetical protein